jgi:NDP-sugar pyrophosphorylase family protein
LAGIYIFKPEILELIPDNTMYGMDKLIMDMLDKGLPISHYQVKEYWLDIGQVEDYNKAQEIYNEYFK